MSAIQKELLAAAGLKLADFKERRDLHESLVKAVNKLNDDEWAKLSAKAQDWYNDAADAVKAKKVPAEFPDYEPEAPESRSRRRSSEPEPEQEQGGAESLEEGQRVEITYKRRGAEKSAKGEVVEVNKRKSFLVVKTADDEVEIDFDQVVRVEIFHGTAGTDDEPAGGPAVGDEVKFTTKRGKEVSGVVKELTDEYVVLDNGDDYDLDRIDGEIEVVKKAGGAKADPEPESRSRRRSSEPDGKDDKGGGDEGGKPPRSSNPKGVSVGGRIRELMAEDPDMTQDEVGKALKKENIEFRDTTLKMIYGDCADIIKKMRDAGTLKKAK